MSKIFFLKKFFFFRFFKEYLNKTKGQGKLDIFVTNLNGRWQDIIFYLANTLKYIKYLNNKRLKGKKNMLDYEKNLINITDNNDDDILKIIELKYLISTQNSRVKYYFRKIIFRLKI